MNKPTDYPLEPKTSNSMSDTKASDMTYAVLRDRVRSEKPVTDEMINIARTKMDTAHISVGANKSEKTPMKAKFNSIRERFKAN